MSHHKNADYKIMKKNSLHHSIKKSIQSQTVQIIMNLIFNDNMHSMILESILSSLRQQAVVNFLLNKQMLILYSHFDDHDNNFSKRIRIKKSADYYNKFLHIIIIIIILL